VKATAGLSRRHPGLACRTLDSRVHHRPVRSLRARQPARAAGSVHRALRSRRHRASLPGGPEPAPRFWRSPTMIQMLAEAKAGGFDLLLAGYSDRWQRNLRRTFELIEDQPPPLRRCPGHVRSAHPQLRSPRWDELVAEATAAERYTRRLAERVRDGYGAKFEHHSTRVDCHRSGSGGRPSRLAPTRSTPTRSARRWGSSSAMPGQHQHRAARTGDRSRTRPHPLHPAQPPLQRLGATSSGPRRDPPPGALAAEPAVSDDLWQRDGWPSGDPRPVAADHATAAGSISWAGSSNASAAGTSARTGALASATRSPSSISIHARPGDPRPALPQQPGRVRSWRRSEGINLDASTMAQVVGGDVGGATYCDRPGARGSPASRTRSEQTPRTRSPTSYLARKRQLRAELAGMEQQSDGGLPAQRAVEWLRAFAESWRDADVPEAKRTWFTRSTRRSSSQAGSLCPPA